jgi:hypothetical protein
LDCFAAGDDHLGCVDDNNCITCVEVIDIGDFVFALEERCDLGGDFAEDHTLGIDQVPLADDGGCFG